jgi:hypothetical protein
MDTGDAYTRSVVLRRNALGRAGQPALRQRVGGFLRKAFERGRWFAGAGTATGCRGEHQRGGRRERWGIWGAKDSRWLWDNNEVTERRSHQRANVGWPLTIRSFRGAMRGKMKDVSCGGAFICANDRLHLQEVFSVTLDQWFMSSRALSAVVRVVRLDIHGMGGDDYPYGAAVKFCRLSSHNRGFLSALSAISTEFSGIAPSIQTTEQEKKRGRIMQKEKNGVRIVVDPESYPAIKIVWMDRQGQEEAIHEETAPLNKDFWSHLERECRDRSSEIDVSSGNNLAGNLTLFADLIRNEIDAEERRERNRSVYEYFADFVSTIVDRTDLDKIRKAQIIHDKAEELQLQ